MHTQTHKLADSQTCETSSGKGCRNYLPKVLYKNRPYNRICLSRLCILLSAVLASHLCGRTCGPASNDNSEMLCTVFEPLDTAILKY